MLLEGSEICQRGENAFFCFCRRRKGARECRGIRYISSWKILDKVVTDAIKPQVVVIWFNAFTGFNNGAVEIHSMQIALEHRETAHNRTLARQLNAGSFSKIFQLEM